MKALWACAISWFNEPSSISSRSLSSVIFGPGSMRPSRILSRLALAQDLLEADGGEDRVVLLTIQFVVTLILGRPSIRVALLPPVRVWRRPVSPT